MARHRRKQIEGSLDSLLDTMTNVVGILVILMAVTQIGVGDAVRKILSRTDAQLREVTDEAINVARDQQAALDQTLKDVTEQWEELRRSLPGEQASLTEIERAVENLRKELADPLDDSRVSRDELAKQIDRDKAEATDLTQKVLRAEGEMEKLKAQLADAPEHEPVEPKVVTLPNPRPAPPGKRELVIFCRDGRVYPVDEDRLKQIGMFHVQQSRPPIDDEGNYDCAKIRDHFAKRRIGDGYFRLRVEIHNHQPFLVLDRLPESGETAADIARRDSRFREMLLDKSNKTYYIRFRVWPDSFDAYVAARQAADDMGWQAGWEPQTRTDEWKIRLEDEIACSGRQARDPRPVTDRDPVTGDPTTDGDRDDEAVDSTDGQRPAGKYVID